MDIRALMMGLAFAFMWSSAFASAKVIVHHAPPLMSLSLRFLISGLIGIALARALGQTWALTRAQWRAIAVFGLSQNALYLGLNFIAMQTVEASLAAIIASSMPLLVAFAGWAFCRRAFCGPWVLRGWLPGLAAWALIMGARMGGGVDLYGVALCVAGVIALTVATLSVRGASAGGSNLLMIVGLQMLVGSVLLAGPALALESFEVQWSWQLGAAFSYTVLIPGLAATWVWFLLVGRIGAVRAATFHFLNPFFLGWRLRRFCWAKALAFMT